jgi:ABC-type uncharacterized transport system permease subunit
VTTVTAHPTNAPALQKAVIRSWKAPIGLGAFTLIAIVLFLVFSRKGESVFPLATGADAIRLPNVTVNAALACWVLVILLAIVAAIATWLTVQARRVPRSLFILFGALFLLAFLVWVAAGAALPGLSIPNLLLGTVALSATLIFGAIGGVISERVGVVNVAIEGQMLAGAFLSAVVSSVTHSAILGLVGAMVAGMLVSFVLAAFSIKYLVDQVIVGVVLNVFVIGLTNYLYSKVLTPNTELLNTPVNFSEIDIPLLSQIPIVGPALFRQNLIVYIMYIAVFAVWFGLFHTRWGLRLRSVGEHPQAADTVGINVARTRFWNVSLAGAIAGLGGAFLTIGSSIAFNREMTAGDGYIALAAVIFGRWDPIRATLAALLFGFTQNLQYVLAGLNSPIPSDFMLMLPYVVTIFAVAGLVGQVRGPAASGKPYVKG